MTTSLKYAQIVRQYTYYEPKAIFDVSVLLIRLYEGYLTIGCRRAKLD